MNIDCDCGYAWEDIHERIRFCETGKICRNPNERVAPKEGDSVLETFFVAQKPKTKKPVEPK